MNALTPIGPPARYCEALRIAWDGTDPAEVMHAHCAALEEMLADQRALVSQAGLARLTALAVTLRQAAGRFGAGAAAPDPRNPPAEAPAAGTDAFRQPVRGDLAYALGDAAAFRSLVQQFGAEAEYLRTAMLACCQGAQGQILTPQEVALAATNAGYDARHLAALAVAFNASPQLQHRGRTRSLLDLLAAAQERLA